MAYRIEEHEGIEAGVRRIAAEQIDLVLAHLAAPDNVDEAVHDARQAFKRIRALVALVRADLGEHVFREENRCYRDAGRLLGGARDAAVLVATLQALTEHYSGRLAPKAFDGARHALERFRVAQVAGVVGADHALSKTAELVAAGRERVFAWPAMPDEFTALGTGLRRSYREGRRGLATVERKPSARGFHEWRKPVKRLWYHLHLVSPAWPVIVNAFAREFHHLSDCLNEVHDLTVLRHAVRDREVMPRTYEVESLTELIDERGAELEHDAQRLGERLYAERPRAFGARVARYWQVWRAEHAAAAAPNGQTGARSSRTASIRS